MFNFGKVKKLEDTCSALAEQLDATHIALDKALHCIEEYDKKYDEAMNNISVVKSDLHDSYDVLKETHKKPTEYMKGIKYAMDKLDAYFQEVNHA